eukprot:scaffold104107_cov26-Tisochrysis_lutea.AAC.2
MLDASSSVAVAASASTSSYRSPLFDRPTSARGPRAALPRPCWAYSRADSPPSLKRSPDIQGALSSGNGHVASWRKWLSVLANRLYYAAAAVSREHSYFLGTCCAGKK